MAGQRKRWIFTSRMYISVNSPRLGRPRDSNFAQRRKSRCKKTFSYDQASPYLKALWEDISRLEGWKKMTFARANVLRLAFIYNIREMIKKMNSSVGQLMKISAEYDITAAGI